MIMTTATATGQVITMLAAMEETVTMATTMAMDVTAMAMVTAMVQEGATITDTTRRSYYKKTLQNFL